MVFTRLPYGKRPKRLPAVRSPQQVAVFLDSVPDRPVGIWRELRPEPWMFPGKDRNQPLNAATVQKVCKRACRAAREGLHGVSPVFGFREAVADCLELATEETAAKKGAIRPANQVALVARSWS
jgi:hypothetical protein